MLVGIIDARADNADFRCGHNRFGVHLLLVQDKAWTDRRHFAWAKNCDCGRNANVFSASLEGIARRKNLNIRLNVCTASLGNREIAHLGIYNDVAVKVRPEITHDPCGLSIRNTSS